MNNLIFGHTWEAIQRAQQRGHLHEQVPHVSPDKQAERILADVEKFKIQVHKDVKSALGIVLPDSYKLVGDLWTHCPD